jgi:tetratricopeptide (TPR) repeat protein
MVEPMIAFVRFGKWDDILSLPKPDDGFIYANVIYRYARGMALARSNRISEASENLQKLDSLAKLDTLSGTYFALNSAGAIARVPLNLLKGEVLIRQKRVQEGLAALRVAVDAENGLRYNEPPDWKIPARHFLGAALLEIAMVEEAEKVYIEDLKKNPSNGWALYGLQQCQARSGKSADANATLQKLNQSWKNSDTKLMASRF